MQPRFEELFASPQHYEKYKARLGKKLAEFRFGFMSNAKMVQALFGDLRRRLACKTLRDL